MVGGVTVATLLSGLENVLAVKWFCEAHLLHLGHQVKLPGLPDRAGVAVDPEVSDPFMNSLQLKPRQSRRDSGDRVLAEVGRIAEPSSSDISTSAGLRIALKKMSFKHARKNRVEME
ncbi:unnamed protein product [Protopolystoma xenopodis]|uniref:Uncharacterized protein n=1 Tax=Protopolystoma xenopodis TaxID=117903 RepID=A0A3S5BQF9_9PLAT|nr:unnamed protein product [Protopolystoma xenopodis]